MNLSEGDDGIHFKQTLNTSSKGAPTAAQFIDGNAKDLGKMICINTEHKINMVESLIPQ